jgi:hypothetical protein
VMGRRRCFPGLGDIFLKARISLLTTHSMGPPNGSGRACSRRTDLIAFIVLSIVGKLAVSHRRHRKRSKTDEAMGKIEKTEPSAWRASRQRVT